MTEVKMRKGLKAEIKKCEEWLAEHDVDDPMYAKVQERYDTYLKMLKSRWIHVDGNTLLMATVSIAEILVILNYEQFRPIVGKAFGLIIRPRL